MNTDEITEKLDRVLNAIEHRSVAPQRISLPDFCRDFNIVRNTAYNWADRGLIKLEKIGGRQFVLSDSISIRPKRVAV